jgi:predicted DNA-binding ribbon-helix-helix protein
MCTRVKTRDNAIEGTRYIYLISHLNIMQIHVVTITDEVEHPNVKNLVASLRVDCKNIHVLKNYDKMSLCR